MTTRNLFTPLADHLSTTFALRHLERRSTSSSLPARKSPMESDATALLELCKRELSKAKELKSLRILESLQERLADSASSSNDHAEHAPPMPRSAVSTSTPAAKKRARPAASIACILCRRCKTKCIMSDPASGRCDRCIVTGRLPLRILVATADILCVGCVCEMQPHKRGRKR